MMLVGDLVAAVAQTRLHSFAQSDLLVLCNFIVSSQSFLQSSETFAARLRLFLHPPDSITPTPSARCLQLRPPTPDAKYVQNLSC
jgi:hypothetical protein